MLVNLPPKWQALLTATVLNTAMHERTTIGVRMHPPKYTVRNTDERSKQQWNEASPSIKWRRCYCNAFMLGHCPIKLALLNSYGKSWLKGDLFSSNCHWIKYQFLSSICMGNSMHFSMNSSSCYTENWPRAATCDHYT